VSGATCLGKLRTPLFSMICARANVLGRRVGAAKARGGGKVQSDSIAAGHQARHATPRLSFSSRAIPSGRVAGHYQRRAPVFDACPRHSRGPLRRLQGERELYHGAMLSAGVAALSPPVRRSALAAHIDDVPAHCDPPLRKVGVIGARYLGGGTP